MIIRRKFLDCGLSDVLQAISEWMGSVGELKLVRTQLELFETEWTKDKRATTLQGIDLTYAVCALCVCCVCCHVVV